MERREYGMTTSPSVDYDRVGDIAGSSVYRGSTWGQRVCRLVHVGRVDPR